MAELSDLKIQTFRFVFSNETQVLLETFSEKHLYTEDRASYKEAWKNWTEDPDVKHQLQNEIQYLTDQGFTGDALDNMYKSVRYYHTKRLLKEKAKVAGTNIIEKKDRKKSMISFTKSFLKEMDDHIKYILRDNAMTISYEQVTVVSPANAYVDFCNTRKDNILEEIRMMDTTQSNVAEELAYKLKKTYKNRYYNIRTTMSTA